jgi:hypothetical protein
MIKVLNTCIIIELIFFRKFKRENEPLSFEESEYRALLIKQWHKVKSKQHHTELSILSTAMEVQMNALNSLRQESLAETHVILFCLILSIK